MLLLPEILNHAARAAPDRTAVLWGGDDVDDPRPRSLSYGELAARAGSFAGLLVSVGVAPGDLVAWWAPNRPEFVEFLFGAGLCGAVPVPLDHWWTADEALRAIATCSPRVIVAGAGQAAKLEPLAARLADAGVASRFVIGAEGGEGAPCYEAALRRASPVAVEARPDPDDPALILFTSGSTGESKGAVHTHRGLAATASIMALELGLREGEVSLHFLPMFSSCLEHLIPLTLVRATHVIQPRFDPDAVWGALDEHGVTHFDAVPTTLRWLLEAAPDRLPAALRLVSYASEPMPEPVIRAWCDRFPDVGFVQFYGMIEQLCLTVQKPWEQLSAIGTVGRPMMGARLRVAGEGGRALPPGQTGEVEAATPTLMAGYWQDREATGRVMRDGWMRTGDLGRFDDHGFLILDGRLKDVIKSGGMTVVPREVETVLLGHPAVIEVAVVGRADERWGEAVEAFVSLRPGVQATGEELAAFCRSRLAGYKRPRSVHVLPELPKTGIGKIARGRLAALGAAPDGHRSDGETPRP
jgi:acyl-CoA synthetase (AMP-forming)/AMP-acid ligase II